MTWPWGSTTRELPQNVRLFSWPIRFVAQMYILLAIAWERRMVIHASSWAACSCGGSLLHHAIAVG